MHIIAFVAPKLHGKSTAAKYVIEKTGGKLVNMKMAIIAEMNKYYGATLDEIGKNYNMTIGQLFDEKPPIMRELMKDFGLMRRAEKGYWTTKWMINVMAGHNESKGYTKFFVVDDIRYKDEQQAVIDLGHIVEGIPYKSTFIRLVRTDLENNDPHPSEQEQKEIECNYIVTTDGKDVNDMYKQLDEILEKLV